MKDTATPHEDAFETLLEELAKLPKGARASCGLYHAARLIEDSAYAFAYDLPGEQIADLIVMAAKVEQSAKTIEEADQLSVK